MDTSGEIKLVKDIECLLDTQIYRLPKWISKHNQRKLRLLSVEVYNTYTSAKQFKQITSFSKSVKILLKNLEMKILLPNAVYYLIKTLHLLHIYLKYLPKLALQLIIGKSSPFSKIVRYLNVILTSFASDAKVNGFLFLDSLKGPKYPPISNCSIIASILHEYLKLCNIVIKEIFFCNLSDAPPLELDAKCYTNFVNEACKVKLLNYLISPYGSNEFQYEKQHQQSNVMYENEMYYKYVIKSASVTLFPPPPAYILRIILLEFLEQAIKLARVNNNFKSKLVWIPTLVCRIANGQVKVCNKNAVKTRIKLDCKGNLSQLIISAISLIDADYLTIYCNSKRYVYGQYFLSLPSRINEQDGTVTTLALGSRLFIDPKLSALIVYKIHSIALSILAHLDKVFLQSAGNELLDKLVNIAWYYTTGFPRQIDFPETNIKLNYCCGGNDEGIKCTSVAKYNITESLKLVGQSTKNFTPNDPYPSKYNLVHLDLSATTGDTRDATLQDCIEFSVDKGYWIIDNKICNKYISPNMDLKHGREINYIVPQVDSCRCNIFCLYNRHIYINVSWLYNNQISMPSQHRKKIVIKAIEMLLKSTNGDDGNAEPFSGFSTFKGISKRNLFLLKSLVNTHNDIDMCTNLRLGDQTMIIYSRILSQIV